VSRSKFGKSAQSVTRLHAGKNGTVGPRFNGLIGEEGVSAIAESQLNRIYFKNMY
jgi:hypothetical protein